MIAEAQRFPGQEKDVFDYYSKNRHAMESMRAPIYEDKVVDFILALATVTEKEVTPEELTADFDDEADAKPKKKAPSKKDDGDKGEDKKPAAKKSSKK